jgi:SAM-dependent methyltransferase
LTDSQISWKEKGAERHARWHSEGGVPVPKRVVIADDTLNADRAYRLACEGTAMLWRGDFQNARLLLQALGRRIDSHKKPPKTAPKSQSEAFHLYRMGQAQRARTLGMLLVPFDADHTVPLRRAPDVKEACMEAYGEVDTPYVTSLRELVGLIGAHEWRRKGLEVEEMGVDISGANRRIHAHYGVFAPVRGEYLQLVARAPLPKIELAFDIGTGTGVLAAILAKRGLKRIIATDTDPRALACARDNMQRLGYAERVEVVEADLFPPGDEKANLIVCNPPWLPGKPGSPLERAIYDQDSRMLKGFLAGLAERLAPAGEGWLVLSDFAEHLGLRTREELMILIAAAGLKEVGRLEARPQHPKSNDQDDPLHGARKKEVTTLWRLAAA